MSSDEEKESDNISEKRDKFDEDLMTHKKDTVPSVEEMRESWLMSVWRELIAIVIIIAILVVVAVRYL